MSLSRSKRFSVLSVALIRSTLNVVSLIVSVLLIEIAQGFGKSIGVASQMMTFSSVLGAFTALAMTFLTVKYSPTSLVKIGLALCFLSSLGSIFAPAYSVLFLLYGLTGIGTTLVAPMTTTIIGELTSGEERSKSLGIVLAGSSIFWVFGYLIVGWISEWRLAFTYFATPVLALSLLAAVVLLPTIETRREKESLFMGLRRIMANRSALSCLFATNIMGVWVVALNLTTSYWRDIHGMPLSTVTILTAAIALTNALGSLAGGRFVPRLGIKRTTTICRILLGASLIVVLSSRDTLVSVAVAFFLSFTSGFNSPAGIGLKLRQVPEYRGSMMSLNSATGSLGSSLNLALMGVLLTSYGWAYASTVIGVIGIISGVLVHLFVTENPQQA